MVVFSTVVTLDIKEVFKNTTLESGIDVAPWINVASGQFYKKNKRSPLKCANLNRKI